MRLGRLGGMQVGSLALAAVLCGYGIYDLAKPRAQVLQMPTGKRALFVSKGPVHVTENGTRIGGLFSVGFGIGLAILGLSVPSARRRRFDRHGRALPDGESGEEE